MSEPAAQDVPPSHAAGLAAVFVLVFFGCCLLSLALPHDPYFRFQQLNNTSMRPLLWAYERIEFDRTPIDIALVGDSRLAAAVSAPKLGRALEQSLGHPVHVANMAVPHAGRSVHYEVARQVLETRPEVKLIVVNINEFVGRNGHRAFRSMADTGEVIGAPLLINREYLKDVAFLPYRQVSLFVESLEPEWFGLHRNFDPALYRGTDFDSTASELTGDGRWIDRESVHPAAELQSVLDQRVSNRDPPVLPDSMSDYEFVIERHYTRELARLAARKGVQVLFVYLPMYNYPGPIRDFSFYSAMGPVFRADELSFDHRNYSDFGHFNHIGSDKLLAKLTRTLVAMERAGQIHIVPAAGGR